MPVTSKDIAEKLGLSQSTVSRVLSGVRLDRISAETQRRVLEAARQMGYQPNAIARSLRHGRTNVVGFYTGYGYLNARNTYLAALLGGLQEACDEQRQDILLHGVFRGRSTDDIYGELMDGRIDGLFLHTSHNDPLVSSLARSSLPVVALSDAVPELPCVVADDAGGVAQLVAHLWDRGHRRIAFLAPVRLFISVERRVKAFENEMRARGVETPLVIRVDRLDIYIGLEVIPMGTDRPTAVCCWNDNSARSLRVACYKQGLRVPDDLALTGFDGVLENEMLEHSLTTIAVPWNQMGRTALETLRVRKAGGEPQSETCVPVQLAIGEST